jgi:hypothetical protein
MIHSFFILDRIKSLDLIGPSSASRRPYFRLRLSRAKHVIRADPDSSTVRAISHIISLCWCRCDRWWYILAFASLVTIILFDEHIPY